jgi:hypothetical protein
MLRPWYQKMMTYVRLMSPWNSMNRATLDEALSLHGSKVSWDTDCLGVEP